MPEVKKRFALKAKRMQGTEKVRVQHELFVHEIYRHQYTTLWARSVCSLHYHKTFSVLIKTKYLQIFEYNENITLKFLSNF